MAKNDTPKELQDAPKEVQEAAAIITEADQSGGDAFGMTEDPSPTLQAEIISKIVAENGTVTEVPSAELSKDQLKKLNGE